MVRLRGYTVEDYIEKHMGVLSKCMLQITLKNGWCHRTGLFCKSMWKIRKMGTCRKDI